MKITDLDTPALLIDLDRVEHNLARWQACCDRAGVRNRPHIKTHKIPELARMQVAGGAVGVTCQKLGEAEIMADAGIYDLFLSYNIVGETKLQRLQALHRRVNLRVVADGLQVIEGLERAAARVGKPLEVMIECDTGMNRCGVQTPAEAVVLAKRVAQSPHLTFQGFSTYPTRPASLEFFSEAVALARREGLSVAELSGGGTPGMWNLPEHKGITEHRAGTYLYNDLITVAAGDAAMEDCALSVLVSVVSTAGPRWVTVDGGTKTFSSDQYGREGFGVRLDDVSHRLVRCSEEHGVLAAGEEKPLLELGDKVRMIPNHACIVSNLHDTAYAVRGEEVVAQWQIAARGKLQ